MSSQAGDRRYYSIDEQERIARAVLALWTGVDPKQEWKDAVDEIVTACGCHLKMSEAFLIASYHPRTTYDLSWRSQVEALLIEREHWGWDPSPGPRCKLVRDALAAGTPAAPEEQP